MNRDIAFMTEQELCETLVAQGLFENYLKLREYERRLFTEFCTGQSLTLLTYDQIFKYVFNSDGSNRRLEHFLTAVLGFEVHIEQVLPLESPKLVEGGSVLCLDVLAKTEDGSCINVEMQKFPYKFCGERESCYQSDMIMRQYNLRKQEAKADRRKFDYKEMRPVYSIILLEKSYYEFLKSQDQWKHVGKMQFDTGIQLNFLENVIYIALDKFRNLEENIFDTNNQNDECVVGDTELKKWMYLFSADTPERISKAAAMSEEFFDIICDVAGFCMDVGEVLNMFSEALRIMDKNTQELMYAEAMEELTEAREELAEAKEELTETKAALSRIREICSLVIQGMTLTEIAEKYQITEDEVEELLRS